MSDWFSTAVAMQREIVRAQKAQMDAARTLIDMSKDITELQRAGIAAGEANLRLWQRWSKLWGGG
ncbi:hypothetical protein [Stakelama flava]|uniref:hypothetical protein n=1 Tax=Stakelama flava TaxID=2860338 RepID=UPI001FE2EE93|nr:hypothetical protein [Stakelama flava]